jgi:hypothetical protein
MLEPGRTRWCNPVVRFVAMLALLVTAAVAVQPAPAVRPYAPQKGPPWYSGPPIGVVWRLNGPNPVLTRLDPSTLAPGGPRLGLGRSAGAWSFDPVDRWLVVAINGTRLRFVDVDKMRLIGDVKLGWRGSPITLLTWLFPDRFVAVTPRVAGGAELAWIDAAEHRILQRRDLDALPWAVASGGGTAVALLPPSKTAIGGARLAVAGRDGRLRIAQVPRIQIGSELPSPRDRGVFRRVLPGLAVSAAGECAYVIGAAGVVAEVDLHTLAVSYHSPAAPRSFRSRIGAWLEPAADAKGLDGPQVHAQWLGNGIVAVAGTRYHLARTATARIWQSVEPTGLWLIDTRRWTQRTIDKRASGFALAGDTILAFGVRSEFLSGETRFEGMGVSAYAPDATKRFDVLEDVPISSVQAGGGRAYAWRSDTRVPWRIAVVDVDTGAVEQELTLEHPTRLLLGEPTYP